MTVRTLLAELRRLDVAVWIDGDRLRCSAPAGALTPELHDRLQKHKHDILAFLRSVGAHAREQRAIVPLQPRGERAPVFGVGGHNGDVFCYRYLAPLLSEDQPFYGLQPPGLDGQSEPLTDVAEIAAYFARQIRAFGPRGPYHLAGYCAGGTIAFELGRQLLQQGAPVASLALFGAPYPSRFRRRAQMNEWLDEQRKRVVLHARSLASLAPGEWREYLGRKLRDRRLRRAGEQCRAADPELALRAGVERATISAGSRYTPGYFGGVILLFLPCAAWARTRNEPLRWQSLAARSEVHCGPQGCDGDNMLRQAYAPWFAERLRHCLAAASDG